MPNVNLHQCSSYRFLSLRVSARRACCFEATLRILKRANNLTVIQKMISPVRWNTRCALF